MKISEGEQVTARLNNEISKLRGDIENWQEKTRQAENKARDMDRVLYENNNEKERLSSLIKSKNYEYEELRNKYSRLEGDNHKIAELEGILHEQHVQIVNTSEPNLSLFFRY